MHLTKLELQEMLREMGVKFSHTESYENLKKLFQEENHMRWMGKVSSNGQHPKRNSKRVIRKRATNSSKEMVVLSKPTAARNSAMPASGSISKSNKHMTLKSKNRRKLQHPRSKISTSKIPHTVEQSEVAKRNKDIFATVLRRSQHCCELCGYRSDSDKEEERDTSFYRSLVIGFLLLCPWRCSLIRREYQ